MVLIAGRERGHMRAAVDKTGFAQGCDVRRDLDAACRKSGLTSGLAGPTLHTLLLISP